MFLIVVVVLMIVIFSIFLFLESLKLGNRIVVIMLCDV